MRSLDGCVDFCAVLDDLLGVDDDELYDVPAVLVGLVLEGFPQVSPPEETVEKIVVGVNQIQKLLH